MSKYISTAEIAQHIDELAESDSREPMNVGDINSDKAGSGARDNSGKPDWSLMPLYQLGWLAEIMTPGKRGVSLLVAAGRFQSKPTIKTADELLVESVKLLESAKKHHSLIDTFSSVVPVWEYGLHKYAAWNWAKGMQWSVPLACLLRHLHGFSEGNDPESGQPHAAHIVCNAMMLRHFVEFYPKGNDMPTKWFGGSEVAVGDE